MSNIFHVRSWRCLLPTIALAAALSSLTVQAAPQAEGGTPNTTSTVSAEDAYQVAFAFDRMPWRDVIRWLADEFELALHYEELPPGTFSYSDEQQYDQEGAIDRINLFLVPQGFTLVRSGRLLAVINLVDPRGIQQLDALAKLTTADQLASLPEQDVVKCLFPLEQLSAEDAMQELSVLSLLSEPAIFSKTNQLMITDTVKKLRNVKMILDAFKPRTMTNGTVVKTFQLEHVGAEDILVVARPHLGLATGEMIGIDVSISADVQGKNIFVTGVEDKVTLIENLVTSLDQPQGLKAIEGQAVLKSHLVGSGNVETVYNVLQTLLAGKTLRLSMDENTSSIVALATPETQLEIEQTVLQLEGSEAEFEVIPLRGVDPYLAISLIEEMLDLPDDLDDPDDIDPNAPKIDADPGNRRLFVRARAHQIDQIKRIVDGLESGQGAETIRDSVRVLPFRGESATGLLELAARFWTAKNPVLLYPSTVSESDEPLERVINESEKPKSKRRTKLTSASERIFTDQNASTAARFLTRSTDTDAEPIYCQLTSRGLVLQSEDSSALVSFEQHLRSLAGPVSNALPARPTIYYLKYTKPIDALRMLAELLDGGEAAREAEADTLVNGYVSSPGSFLGSIVTSRDGTMTMMAGTITVVADSRLNRLIAQGTTDDMELIESYLEIIDKDASLTTVETYGTAHIIELEHTTATVMADVLRQAFAGRITSGSSNGATGQPGQQGQQPAGGKESKSKNDDDERQANNKKNPPRGASSQPERDLEPKMTIAVHEPSNSLIVTAPDPLYREVMQLVEQIDGRSEQSVEIVAGAGGSVLQAILQPGGSGERRSTSTRGESANRSRSSLSDLIRAKAQQR